ncbi:MAG: hypothetical protein IIA12_07295 [Proteobacteria bacterium]|nr:hypothetical protein [Pseudomonadota bacterium]
MLAVIQSRRDQRKQGKAPLSMVGLDAVVVTALDPQGTIRVRGETWTARAASGGPVEEGASVRTVREEGAMLTVERANEPAASEAAANEPTDPNVER